jgi:S-layer homology domain.
MYFACLIPANAMDQNAIQNKADSLYKVKVLMGNGKDYNLDSKLKKSEAAAFIVRLLGMEKVVMSKKDNYSNTSFSDVQKNKWYAPYIGFCAEKGIITSNSDGTYKPDSFIGEKEFLKFILLSMGYIIDTDFTLENIYQIASKEGIIESSITKETTEFKRSNAVVMLYNSLMLRNKNANKLMIQILIDNGMVSRQEAISAGFLMDNVKTTITDIQVNSPNKITVIFNENIEKLDIKNMSIYETENNNSILNISIESMSNNTLVLSTSTQVSGKEYMLKLSNIIDIDGNTVDYIEKAFTGYLEKEVVSNYFKINKIVPVSKSQINVFFTQPVTSNAAVPMRFDIVQNGNTIVDGSYSNLSTSIIGGVNNGITLWLKDIMLSKDTIYNINISGDLTSQYGVRLGGGNGESRKFISNGKENTIMDIENITAVDEHTLKLEFNVDLDRTSAENLNNYVLKDTTNNTRIGSPIRAKLQGEGNNIYETVYLYFSATMSSDKTYELTIDNLKDSFKEREINETVIPFCGSSEETEKLEILDVTAYDSGTVYVYFSQPLDPSAATNASNFILSGKKSVYFNAHENNQLVKIFMNSANQLDESSSYTLRVQTSITDFLKRQPTEVLEATFKGTDTQISVPSTLDAIAIGDNKVKLTFSGDVETSGTNAMANNYRLRYSSDNNSSQYISAKSVVFINSTTAIITFDSFDTDRYYTFISSSIRDISGQYILYNDERLLGI